MQYMILIYIDDAAYYGAPPEQAQAQTAAFGRYTAELHEAGVWRGGSKLGRIANTTTVRVRGGKLICTDGPFAETKEQLGGYYLIECANLDEAMAWAGRCPAAPLGSIEVRPLA
jgi:hypothetical protein